MSKTYKRKNVMTKHKHVIRDALDDYVLPEENQQIVQILCGKGNYLHEVKGADDETFLVSMPTKFRHNLWIKKGDYVLVDSIQEGDKVRGEIVRILFKEDISYIRSEGKWPFSDADKSDEQKSEASAEKSSDKSDSDDSESNSDDDLFVNTNRPPVYYEESSDDSGSEADKSNSTSGDCDE